MLTSLTTLRHVRFLRILRKIGFPTSAVDFTNLEGDFWPTIVPVLEKDETVTHYGAFQPQDYTNDDIVRSSFLTVIDAEVFPDLSFTAEEITDKKFLDALAGPALAGLPANYNADNEPRLCHGQFNANYHGIKPAVAAADGRDASPRSCWIVLDEDYCPSYC